MLALTATTIAPCASCMPNAKCHVMSRTAPLHARVQWFQRQLQPKLAPCYRRGFCDARRPRVRVLKMQCSDEASLEQQEAAMRDELSDFEGERDACLYAARASSLKCTRLTEKMTSLTDAALRAVRAGDELEARRLLGVKAALMAALNKCQARSEANMQLASRLEHVISRRQSQLIAMLAGAAAEQAAAAAAQQGRISAPLRQEWTAGGDGESEDGWAPGTRFSSRSGSSSAGGAGRLPGLDGTIDSVDSAFLNMERRSLEGLWNKDLAPDQEPKRRAQPSPSPRAASPPAAADGLQQWWVEAAALSTADEDAARLLFTDVSASAAAAEQAATLLRVIVNVRIKGRDPKMADVCKLADMARTAKAGGLQLQMPADFPRTLRSALFRAATSACVDALDHDDQRWARFQPGFGMEQVADFLVRLAQLLKLEAREAARTVTAAVASQTRGILLEAAAALKREVTATGRLRQAKQDAARLHRVLETLTPPPDSPELAAVPGGLRGFMSAAEARLLLSAYSGLPGAKRSAWACAIALDF